MKKFLIVAHYSRFLVQFEMSDVQILQNMGYEVHYATNYTHEDMYADAPQRIREAGVVLHQIDFVRSPYNIPKNIKAYKQLCKLLTDIKFDGMHCHTPMAGVLARLAAKKMKVSPVLYTGHGFHFYKGCPWVNNVIYKTAEIFCSRYSDAIITINEEDYQAAKKFPLRGKAYKIPGVGVDVSKIQQAKINKDELRQKLNIPLNAFVFVSIGELIKRKNHQEEIAAFCEANIPNSYLLIIGSGSEYENLDKQICDSKMKNNIWLLGFRKDAKELLYCADAFLFASKQEGLGLVGIEAMAVGLPLITTNIRGITEYSEEPKTGYTYTSGNVDEFAQKMKKMYMLSVEEKRQISQYNQKEAYRFDCSESKKIMERVYFETLSGN